MRVLSFPSPPLSQPTAYLLTLLFATTYVGSIYYTKRARISYYNNNTNGKEREKEKERWRDDPEVIKARLVAVSIATLACCAVVFGVVWWNVRPSRYKTYLTIDTTLARLGLSFHFSHIPPYLPIFFLYLGPFYTTFLYRALPFQRHFTCRALGTWVGIRNYVVAPVTEELVFRACVLSVWGLAGVGRRGMVFGSPLSFGAAHLHHAYETYVKYGRTVDALKRALMVTLFQLGYTTLFGFYASFLFLRTTSIYPPIVAHIVCNTMGLPRLSDELRTFPKKRKWILTIYALGVIGFAYTTCMWTEVEWSLYWSATDPDGLVRW